MKLPRSAREMLSFLARHLALGLVAALLFGTVLVYNDVAHLRSMSQHSRDGELAIILLYFGLCITFGGFSMVVGIMGQGQDEN